MIPIHGAAPDPTQVVGLTLTDERDGTHTGIYQRTAEGALHFCRDVDRSRPDHHRRVLLAWTSTTPGELQDLRVAGKE